MPSSTWFLPLLSLTEVLLLGIVVLFFWRLRKSEAVLSRLQDRQEELMTKLRFNAQMEQELVATFEKRQSELSALDDLLEQRALELKRLLKQSENVIRSPQFLRQTIISGHKKGKSTREMARSLDLSVEEVELILDQSR